jgi:sugar porter (SP) family MFS transporter
VKTQPLASKIPSDDDRSNRYTIAIALVACLGGLMFGYDIGVIADAKIGLKNEFKFGDLAIESVVSAVLAGSFIGAIIAGTLCDRIGRRKSNIWGGVLFAIGCLGCSVSDGFISIVAFRIVMGMGVGFSSVAGPLYIAEIAAPWSRGGMVSLYQLAITVGILLAFVAGIPLGYLAEDYGWRVAFGAGSLLGAALIFGMMVMPSSPRWLVAQGRLDEAKGVLARTMGSKAVAEKELEAIRLRQVSEAAEGLWNALKTRPAVRVALILAVGLAFLQQASGINAIFYYAPEIFQKIGLGDDESRKYLVAGLGLVNVLATFIAIFLVDRVGRRPLLLVGTALMMVAEIGVAVTGTAIAADPSSMSTPGLMVVVGLVISIVAFAFSLGPLVWLVIAEIFPASVRSQCVGVATSMNWIGNFLIAQGALTAVKFSPSLAFGIFAFFNAITFCFVYWRMPETKGVELEQIEAFFESRGPRKATSSDTSSGSG